MKSILIWTVVLFIFLLLVYLGLYLGQSLEGVNKELIKEAITKIESIADKFWNFIAPFIQLIILFIVLDTALKNLGYKANFFQSEKFIYTPQNIIALFVIISFCLAALAGISGADSLENIALVVIGFYFGSRKGQNQEQPASAGKTADPAIPVDKPLPDQS